MPRRPRSWSASPSWRKPATAARAATTARTATTSSDEAGLAGLLGPAAVDSFLADHYGRRWFHRAGPPDRFERLLSWRDLNRILEDHRLEPPRLRLASEGGSVGEE